MTSASHSKEDLSILKATIFEPIGRGARLIVEAGHFSVQKDSNDDLDLSFSPRSGNNIICNVPNRVLVAGDLKLLAQMLAHENMSGSWNQHTISSGFGEHLKTTKKHVCCSIP